jgi:heme oxygenase
LPISARHARLREATRDAHAVLDGHVGGWFESRDGYLAYLTRMHRFHARLDAAVAGIGPLARPDFGIAARADRLAADLAALGAPVPAFDRASGPALPPVGDAAAQLGVLYVLAGSTLGARVLARTVAALGLADGAGATCLAAMARGDAWPRALAEIDAAPDGSEAPMIRAARATFRSVRDHLGLELDS